MAMLPTRSNLEKTIQAAGVLLRREGKRMSRLRLLKLLYVADRRGIQQFGMPILGPRYVAMNHGPLHGQTHDLVNGCGPGEAAWSMHFQNVGRDIRIESEPETSELSRHETAVLNQVSDELVTLNDWEIAEMTRGFQEWIRNYAEPSGNSPAPIPFEDVVVAVGRTSDLQSILQDVRDSDAYDRFFGQLSSAVLT